MPNKSEITVLTGLPKDLDNSLVVQKSRPLFALWQSNLTLSSFKIMDAYLAKIDSHKPENRRVRFSKGELERILGVTKLNKKDLEARLKALYTPIDLEYGNPDALDLVCLFERAKAVKDEYGEWQVDLNCTESAMKYVFNVDKMGYFRYKLRSITSLQSRYSYILFMYLEVNRRYKNEWVVPLDELRKMLHCDNDPSYKEFKTFNQQVLKKCRKDLHEKTDCRYSYETVKRGKYVVGIKFKLEPLAVALETPAVDPDQPDFDEWEGDEDELDTTHPRDKICLGFSDAAFNVFTDEQLALLKDLAVPKVPAEYVDYHKNALCGDVREASEYAVSDYLRRVILKAQSRVKKRTASALFAYVEKTIKNDEAR